MLSTRLTPFEKHGNSQADEKRTQKQRLLQMAIETDLFHTPDRECYATIQVDDHKEHWPLLSKEFRSWLLHQYYVETGDAPDREAVQSALNVLTSRALFDAPERTVHIRIAEYDKKIYLDLCNHTWQVVEIDAVRWRILPDPPVRFVRRRGMGSLPHPELDGSIDRLRPFVNVGTEEDLILLVACLLAGFRARGPYPIINLHGEHGTAKSTLAKVLRALLDPNDAPIRSEPKDERDLMIAARNGWQICLDNLSSISSALSDSLCRLSTGGGFATRELYSDVEEVIINAQRPVIINGIDELATRADLVDRCVIFDLPFIPDSKRQPEQEFWQKFETARPQIMGALLSGVSTALKNVDTTKLANHPRLADFAVWATAAESGFGWESGAFMAAYTKNRACANELALECSPIASAVLKLVSEGEYQGTATDLLNELSGLVDEGTHKQRAWPGTPKALSTALRRIAPNLRRCKVDVVFSREPGRNRSRTISLRKFASAPSESSDDAGETWSMGHE